MPTGGIDYTFPDCYVDQITVDITFIAEAQHGSASLGANATLSGSGIPFLFGSSPLSPYGVLTATASVSSTSFTDSANLQAHATVSASGSIEPQGVAALNPHAILSASGSIGIPAVAVLRPTATLIAKVPILGSSSIYTVAVAGFSGTAKRTFSATLNPKALMSAGAGGISTINPHANLTAIPTVPSNMSVSLNPTATIQAMNTRVYSASVVLTGEASVRPTATGGSPGIADYSWVRRLLDYLDD